MKKYIELYKDLNTDERQILGSVFVFILGAAFFIYLLGTATPHRKDAETRDYQTYLKPNYELPKSFDKYCNHVYNDKFK